MCVFGVYVQVLLLLFTYSLEVESLTGPEAGHFN